MSLVAVKGDYFYIEGGEKSGYLQSGERQYDTGYESTVDSDGGQFPCFCFFRSLPTSDEFQDGRRRHNSDF
jgi:hypothetical protein